jgi:ribonuclease VapC
MAPLIYAIDAQPLVAWVRKEAAYPLVEAIARKAQSGEVELRLTSVNAGEVVYGVERALGAVASQRTLQLVQETTEIQWVDLELAARAAWIKLRSGIGYADCFAAALAHRDGAPLITGDPDFRRVEDLISIAWLEDLRI